MAKAVVPVTNALAAIAIRREATEEESDIVLRRGDEPGPVFGRFIQSQSGARDSGKADRVPIVCGPEPINLRALPLHHVAKGLEHAPLHVITDQTPGFR